MYCVRCGVKLADTEEKCPLCGTTVYHPDIRREEVFPLYPRGKTPKIKLRSKAFNGALIILFLIPILVSLLADWQTNGQLNWFGFAAGAMVVGYVAFALPLWFKRPNPVIFVPCTFAALAAYLFYIDLVTKGGWFLSFALPVVAGVCLIAATVVTLLRYLRRGRLYIWGGAFIASGALMLLVEFLMEITFELGFLGWSIYPLIVLALFGGFLIFLAINHSARETMERKLFF